MTDAQAEELVEQTLATGRSGLSEAEFVRVRDFLRADPDDGPALFASKGTAVIDDPVTAGRYADLCLNSFAGGTLVVLADGSRVPITSVSVGDRVAAFDVSLGLVVDRPVTAVLSHDDVLFDVSLSDGSMLSVTEDHSVLDVSSQSWMPISEFDADDVLLGLSGATLTVTDFDETSGANTTAWDLSVGGAHNFFVAAHETAEPVLVHNASDFCPLPITLAQFKTLADITDPVEAAAYADVLTSFGRIAQLNDLGVEAYEASVKALVDFAGTNPGVATELVTTRPLWVKAAALRGPGSLEVLLDAAVSAPLLRNVGPDVISRLARRSDVGSADFEALNTLSANASLPFINRVLSQADVGGALQQLKGGPGSVRYSDDGVPLNVFGERVNVQRPAFDKLIPGSGTVDNGDYLVDGVVVQVRNSFPVFQKFMGEGANRRQILFYDLKLDSGNDLGRRLPPDFRKANNEMMDRIARWDAGATDAAIEEMPAELRAWFREGTSGKPSGVFDRSPKTSDGKKYTWHHHEETGRMQLVRLNCTTR